MKFEGKKEEEKNWMQEFCNRFMYKAPSRDVSLVTLSLKIRVILRM